MPYKADGRWRFLSGEFAAAISSAASFFMMKSDTLSRIDGGADILENSCASLFRSSVSSPDNFPFAPAVASLIIVNHVFYCGQEDIRQVDTVLQQY